jgi:hypothetical protein
VPHVRGGEDIDMRADLDALRVPTGLSTIGGLPAIRAGVRAQTHKRTYGTSTGDRRIRSISPAITTVGPGASTDEKNE